MNKIWTGNYGKIKMEAEVEQERIKMRVFQTQILSSEMKKLFKELGISTEETEDYTEISSSLSGRCLTKEEWFIKQRLETLYGLLVLCFDKQIRCTFDQVFLEKE